LRAFQQNKDEEFGFFDTVTRISGELKKIPKENEEGRKEGLIKHAEKLEQSVAEKPNLYLPTNIDHKILGLDPYKSRTLKSAKKVPILIPLKIKRVDQTGKVYPEMDVKCISKWG
jgi:phosphatidylinositol 4-kinase